MKRLASLCFVVLVILSVPTISVTQRRLASNDLARIIESLKRAMTETMPGWELSDVPPTSPPDSDPDFYGVSITQWTLNDQRVRVAIIQHGSQEEAIRSLQQFATGSKATRTFDVVSDEAYIWGIRGALAFRKKNFTIYITAVVNEPNDEKNPQIFEQKVETEHTKEKALTKTFAQHAAAAFAANTF